MEVSPTWSYHVGFGPVEHRTAVLVEDGPQYVQPRVPESWTVRSDGIPRAGWSRLPADYAYVEFVKATVEKHLSEKMPGAGGSGQIVDVLA